VSATENKIYEFIGKNIKSILFLLALLLSNYYLITNEISSIKSDVAMKTSKDRIINIVKDSIDKEEVYFPNVEGQILKEQLRQLKENNDEFKRLLERLEEKIN